MILYLFKCSNCETRTGLTPDQTGGNLPPTECPGGNWIFWQTLDINPGDPGRIGAAPADKILEAIAQNGYYINNAKIIFSQKEI